MRHPTDWMVKGREMGHGLAAAISGSSCCSTPANRAVRSRTFAGFALHHHQKAATVMHFGAFGTWKPLKAGVGTACTAGLYAPISPASHTLSWSCIHRWCWGDL